MNEKSGKPFQFGLRDVIWGTLVVALLVGWWASNREQEIRIKRRTDLLLMPYGYPPDDRIDTRDNYIKRLNAENAELRERLRQ